MVGSRKCRSADSNRDGISPTAPSRQRVYQFHHFGVTSISRRKDRREMVDGSGRGPLVRWSGGQSRFRVGQSLGGRRLLVSQGFFLDNAACALRIVGQQVQTDDDQHVKRRQYGRHLTQESRGAPAAEHLASHAAGWAARSESAGQATALARLQQDRQDQNETDHDVYCNCGGKHGMYPSIGERRQRIRIRQPPSNPSPARTMASKDEASRLAPPTSAPSMCGRDINAPAFSGLTLPPY